MLVRELATGTLTYTENMTLELSKSGVEVMIAYTGSRPGYPASGAVKLDEAIPPALDSSLVTQLFRFLTVLFSLRRCIGRFRPHVIITQGLDENGFIGSLASSIFGIPAISFVHDLTLKEFLLKQPKHGLALYGLSLLRQKITARRLSAIIVGSNFMSDSISRMFGVPVRVTRLGAGRGLGGLRANPPALPFRIIFVGNLTRKKRPDIPIRVAAALGDLDLKLELVGDGPERDPLTRLREQLKAGDRVELKGHLADADLSRELLSSHLCVVPSFWEGFGLSAVEAMSCGVPVIATDSGGLRELVVNGRNGFLVPLNATEKWAEYVRLLYSDRDLLGNLSANAYETSRKFDWARTANDTLEIVKALIRPRSG